MTYSRLMGPKHVFSWWQNGLMAGVCAFCALLFVCLGRIWTIAAVAFAVFAIRTAMLGVSRDGTGLIRIRSLLRTWKLRPDQILHVEAEEYRRMDGARYFAPVVYLDRTADRRPDLPLWWLAAFTEAGAQRWADRVTALLATAR